MERKKYDSTVARIAGNILSGVCDDSDLHRVAMHGVDEKTVRGAVALARAIVAEVQRPEIPEDADAVDPHVGITPVSPRA